MYGIFLALRSIHLLLELSLGVLSKAICLRLAVVKKIGR
ncbi:unnamed protein product [Brassica rapa subsp. trilocularis]